MTTTTPAGAGERCQTCKLLKDDPDAVFCSNPFHLPTRPTPDLSGLEQDLYKAADDIFSGATIFSDRVHGLLIAAADALKAAGEERDAAVFVRDLIEKELSDRGPRHKALIEAADEADERMIAAEQENERLREALGEVDAELWAVSGRNEKDGGFAGALKAIERITRAALSPQGGDAG